MKNLFNITKVLCFSSIVFFVACKNTNSSKNNEVTKDSLKVVGKKIVHGTSKSLIPSAKKEIANWAEFNDVAKFIGQFYNTNQVEALNNAKELSDLVKLMKDSIRIDKLKEVSVKARLNVLENETLRLMDMAEIPSISEREVAEEVTSILELYDALISKINTIYKVEALQHALEVDTETPVEIEKEEKNKLKIIPKISSKKN